jgi:hypothetical protein
MREQGMFEPARLVLIDETCSTALVRLGGRAPWRATCQGKLRNHGRGFVNSKIMLVASGPMLFRALAVNRNHGRGKCVQQTRFSDKDLACADAAIPAAVRLVGY